MRFIGLIIFSTLVFVGSGCRKEQERIPYVPVNFSIDLTLPAYFDLTIPTGWTYVSGGSRGIIIYRNSQNEFTAIDRHSTYNIGDYCKVEVSDDNVILVDPCSESTWLITDGSVVSGPTNLPLQQYNTQFNGNILYVYN